MREKMRIVASGLREVFAGRADTGRPHKLYLTFRQASGPAGTDGREVTAAMSQAELSSVLDALPWEELDGGRAGTFAQVIQTLRHSEVGISGRGGSG